MRRTRVPMLECLEDRLTPTSFSVPWPEANGLTLSFALDRTAAGAQASGLFRALDAQLPSATWQREVLRAFQTWAVEANLNVGLVADGGQAFGTLGLKQGDPRFGDVRIGAYAMAPDVLAVADPYDPFIANTWVGDVFLNSSAHFEAGGRRGAYDLYTVMLHEAGHVLGIGHSSDVNSPMYEHFSQVRTALTPADVAALRALYGARAGDELEGPAGNDSFTTASDLGGGAEVGADITTLDDADVFRLVVPDGSKELDIQLNAAGISLLVGRLDAYDSAGRLVASAVAGDPLHNDLRLRLDDVEAGETYFVKVTGATQDVFAIGAYHLAVHSDGASPAVSEPVVAGIQLLSTTPGYVEHTYYETDDLLGPASPVHTYSVRSADVGADRVNVMTVVLTSPDPAARFQVTVRDDQGQAVPFSTVYEQDGRYAIQVPSVVSDSDYQVEVRAATDRAISYEIEVDFAQDGRHLETFVNDTLDAGQIEASRDLQVNTSQQFHFLLSASDWSAAASTGVRMTIADASGRVVYSLAVADGATRSGDVFLDAGRYTVRFRRATEGVGTPVLFQLSGIGLSEPLGPQLRDTTRQAVESADLPTAAALSFYWLPHTSTAVERTAKPQAAEGQLASALAPRGVTPSQTQVAPGAPSRLLPAPPLHLAAQPRVSSPQTGSGGGQASPASIVPDLSPSGVAGPTAALRTADAVIALLEGAGGPSSAPAADGPAQTGGDGDTQTIPSPAPVAQAERSRAGFFSWSVAFLLPLAAGAAALWSGSRRRDIAAAPRLRTASRRQHQ